MRSVKRFALVVLAVASSGPAFSMGNVIERQNEWVAVEHDDDGALSCSLSWEPERHPLSYRLLFDGRSYRKTITGLDGKASGPDLTVRFEGGSYAGDFKFQWDGYEYQGVEADGDAKTFLDAATGAGEVELTAFVGGRKIMALPVSEAKDVALAMMRCSDALMEGATDDEYAETAVQTSASSAQEFVEEEDPLLFLQKYREQFATLPEEEGVRRLDLFFGYMHWIIAGSCRENGWFYDDQDVADREGTVHKIIETNQIDKALADYVWKATWLSLTTQNSKVTPQECQKMDTLFHVQMEKYAISTAQAIENPFTR